MNRVVFGLVLIAGIMSAAGCRRSQAALDDVSEILDHSSKVLEKSMVFLNDTTLNPRCMDDDHIRFVPSRDWTSGFFPGMLWMMYEYTDEESFCEAAHHYSMNVEDQQYNGLTHDMGFKMYCSFGNGYRLTADSLYRDILLQSARTLITRYNPTVGCLRSWDHNDDKWDFPVIIDNMLNLELLFWATRESSDSTFYDIAVSHAQTTMQNHFREDMSSYHVVSYDTLSGEVMKKNTHQGHAHETAWARGQAWGLYGFTMAYRETSDERFLDQAKEIAGFMLDHPNMPEDKVPFWDFDAPGIPDAYRDVSAAAVMASALYELSGYCPGGETGYADMADQILFSLANKYTLETDQSLPFLLDHSVGNIPENDGIDVPIIYADYYYLEALMRKHKL